MRRALAALGILLLVALAVVGVALAWAHVTVRQEGAALPAPAAVAAIGAGGDGPVRVHWIETARQPMPRSAVLDPGRDPSPGLPYVMAHPAFVLEWADGRILLGDVGMTRDGARDFGALIQRLGDASAMEPLGSAAEQLGAARARVAGVVLSHLHEDHVGGLPALCAGGPATIPVFVTEAQDERGNWTTRAARTILRDAPCARTVRLAGDGPLLAVPGFPGVAVFDAGGHTPGSQLLFARVGDRRLVFVGDIVNHVDGIRHDVPKPFLYSLLIVPEATGRLQALRVWLRGLAETQGVIAVPAHDEAGIRASGIPSWPGAPAG